MDFTDSRKRLRSVMDDDINEFTPLSKRINNLHINPSLFPFLNQPDKFNEHVKAELEQALLSGLEDGSRGLDCLQQPSLPQEWASPAYLPDLSPSENPFYYEQNRILYELYLERSRRNPQPSEY